jgi:hypothetical protein
MLRNQEQVADVSYAVHFRQGSSSFNIFFSKEVPKPSGGISTTHLASADCTAPIYATATAVLSKSDQHNLPWSCSSLQ